MYPPSQQQQQQGAASGSCICSALDISGAMNESQLISSLRGMNLGDDFWMYSFKVTPCQRSYSHKWTLCPCAHAGETARRRDPRLQNYKAVLCPVVKQKRTCPMGDSCNWSHSIFEHWLHPSRYKTRLCSFGRNCNRPICFFAHHSSELRLVGGPEENPKELDEREYLLQLVLAQESGMLPNPGPHQHQMLDQASISKLLMQQQQQQRPHLHVKPPFSQPPPSFGPSANQASSNYPPHLYPPGLGQQGQNAWAGFPSSSSAGIPNSNMAGTSSSSFQQQQAVGMGEGEVDTASMLLGLQDNFNSMSLLDASQWPVGAVSGVPHSRISDPGHIPRPPPQPIGPSNLSQKPASMYQMAGRSSFGGAAANLNYSFLGPSPGFDLAEFQQQQQQQHQQQAPPISAQRASVSEGGDPLKLGFPGLEDILPMVLRQIQSGEWEGLGLKSPSEASSEVTHLPPSQLGMPPKPYLPPNPYHHSPPNSNSYQSQGHTSSNIMLQMPSFGSSAGESVSARSSANVDPGISPISGPVNVDASKRSSICDEGVSSFLPSPSTALAAGGGSSATDALVGKLVHQLQEQGASSKEQLVASLSQLLAQLLEPSKEGNTE